MENQYKISLIIPVYNVEKYLQDCLDSVLHQTFTDYEVICVNDASTDNSAEILAEYQPKFHSMKIIKLDKNSGQSVARNKGLECASGKYIMFLDSDDMLDNQAMEKLFYLAEENSTEILCFSYRALYEDNLKPLHNAIYTSKCGTQDVCTGQEMFCRYVNEKDMKFAPWRKIYLREFFLINKLHFYEGIICEDVLFSFLCLMKASRVMDINAIYYTYRIRSSSTMTMITDLHAESFFLICMEIYKYWSTHALYEKTDEAMQVYYKRIFHQYIKYRGYCDENSRLSIGRSAEKILYSLIGNKQEIMYASLSEEKIKKLKEQKYVIVYGAGAVAIDILDILKRNNVAVEAVAVTDATTNASQMCGLPIRQIQELEKYKNTAMVLISVLERNVGSIEATLQKYGFARIMKVDYIDSVI